MKKFIIALVLFFGFLPLSVQAHHRNNAQQFVVVERPAAQLNVLGLRFNIGRQRQAVRVRQLRRNNRQNVIFLQDHRGNVRAFRVR